MFDFIKKEDRVRYGSIALFLLFIFSTVAIYMFSGYQLGGGSAANNPNAGPVSTSSIDTFNGTASANATLVSWDPSLVVVGQSPGLDSLVQELKDKGIVTYDVTTSEGRILRLSSGAYVFNITQELTAINLTAYDEGVISVPSIYVSGGSVQSTVPGNTFRYNTVPIFDQGDVFPITFTAYVVGGQLYSLGNLRIDTSPSTGLELVPSNLTLNSTFWRVMVPWESRGTNYAQLQANLPGGSTVTYRSRSYVSFNPPLTSAQQSALSAHMPSYGVSIQPTLMGVSLDMTNRSRVINDLRALGLNATFPDSPMDIWAYRYPNETTAQWESRSEGVWNQSFPDIPFVHNTTYRLKLVLPSAIGPGAEYLVVNRTLDLNSEYPPTDGYTLKLIFTPVGRRIVQFDQAEYSPASPGFFTTAGAGTGGSIDTTGRGTPSGSDIAVTNQNGQAVPMNPVNRTSNDTGANTTGAPGPQIGTRAINYTGQLPPGAG